MNREGGNLDFETEWLQASHAFELDRLSEVAGHPKRAFGDSEIERVTQRPGANDVFRGQLWNWAFLFALEMQALGLDLPEMDFHGANSIIGGRLCQTPVGFGVSQKRPTIPSALFGAPLPRAAGRNSSRRRRGARSLSRFASSDRCI